MSQEPDAVMQVDVHNLAREALDVYAWPRVGHKVLLGTVSSAQVKRFSFNAPVSAFTALASDGAGAIDCRVLPTEAQAPVLLHCRRSPS